ncbi:twin-arginine translocase TatA/TatE family subunit [Blastococcus sp. SYSU DS0533]
MLSSIGWGEIVALALVALFVFGPERLPGLAKEAAGGLGRLRGAVTGVRAQLHDTLGEDFDHLRDVDLRRYHPRALLREHLLGEDDDQPPRRGPRPSSGPG